MQSTYLYESMWLWFAIKVLILVFDPHPISLVCCRSIACALPSLVSPHEVIIIMLKILFSLREHSKLADDCHKTHTHTHTYIDIQNCDNNTMNKTPAVQTTARLK